MSARCENVGKYVLPVFRALIAKQLVNTYHLTQVEAAKKLGTTQAAVSQYINSKRAFKGAQQFSSMLPSLEAVAKKTAKSLANNELTWNKVTQDFCKICLTFSNVNADLISEDYVI
jgi:predicted transcriptional regulator